MRILINFNAPFRYRRSGVMAVGKFALNISGFQRDETTSQLYSIIEEFVPKVIHFVFFTADRTLSMVDKLRVTEGVGEVCNMQGD